MKVEPKVICVDFDGTVVKHKYPEVGEPLFGAIETLKALMDNGHKLVLWTMRSGEKLQDAVKYLESNGIKLYGINENPTQKKWTQSPKAYGHLYIDDMALGAPIMRDSDGNKFLDWSKVRYELRELGYL
jgi:predicted mannosyl-3-phosphoglycerate phosphatase (HAD superfamily)